MSLSGGLPVAAQVGRAIRSLSRVEFGTVIGYYPVARMNPFQSLLYCRAFDMGFVPIPIPERADLAELDVVTRAGGNAVLHLHWTAPVLANAETRSEAAREAAWFLAEVDDRIASGAQLVWTIHNVLPHQCRFPDVEARLRQGLADRAHIVHAMSRTTLEDTRRFYDVEVSKVIWTPHPSYLGAYPFHYDRRMARFELGIDPNDLLLGFVGAIRQYKGLDDLAHVTERIVRENPDIRVMVAGPVGDDEESRRLLARLEECSHLHLIAKTLEVDEVAMVMSALDAAVLPYSTSLNSGAAVLAVSYGVPVVAPRMGYFRELIDRGLGVGYSVGDEEGLFRALKSIGKFLAKFEREVALSYARETSGWIVSERFFATVRSRLRSQGAANPLAGGDLPS